MEKLTKFEDIIKFLLDNRMQFKVMYYTKNMEFQNENSVQKGWKILNFKEITIDIEHHYDDYTFRSFDEQKKLFMNQFYLILNTIDIDNITNKRKWDIEKKENVIEDDSWVLHKTFMLGENVVCEPLDVK